MNTNTGRNVLLSCALTLALSSSVHAQSAAMPMATTIPEECKIASASGMKGMDEPAMQSKMQGMMDGMSDAQKAYMDAMMKMHAPMMMGTMAKDADVGFVCGMIPHHQGAIDMARAEIKYGNNAQAKKMAEKVIEDQEKEIKEMTAWLSKNAKP